MSHRETTQQRRVPLWAKLFGAACGGVVVAVLGTWFEHMHWIGK